MKEYKLLPCPFCKSDNVRLVNKHKDVFWGYCYAKCFNCGTRTRQGSLKEIAELWNTRNGNPTDPFDLNYIETQKWLEAMK